MDSFTTIPTEIIWNISFPCCAMLSLVVLLCPTLYDAMASSPPGSSFHGDSPGKNTGVGCHALLQGINPGIETRSPALQADTLPSTPPGKPLLLLLLLLNHTSVMSDSVQPHRRQPTRLRHPWDSPGKNTAISFSNA